MQPTRKLNPLAPIFVPGQRWCNKKNINHSTSSMQPLIVYGDINQTGRPISRFAEQRSTALTSKIFYRKLQDVLRAQHRALPNVDNTTRAARARSAFDRHFGHDEENLQGWQDLCFFCGIGIGNMPASILECKRWLYRQYINIFDIVEAAEAYRVVEPRFDNVRELEIYSRQTGKICPISAGNGNELFQFMLKRWF